MILDKQNKYFGVTEEIMVSSGESDIRKRSFILIFFCHSKNKRTALFNIGLRKRANFAIFFLTLHEYPVK